MALTRAFLNGMGLTAEQVTAIIEGNADSINGIKAERDQYKAEAERLTGVQEELNQLKSQVGKNSDWQTKYEKEHEEFERYKLDVETQATRARISEAYKKLLIDNHVGESHIDSILRVTDFSNMQIGEDGKIVNESETVDAIKSEWSGFIASVREEGAGAETPPAGTTMTKDAFDAMPLNQRMEYANSHPAEVAGFFK